MTKPDPLEDLRKLAADTTSQEAYFSGSVQHIINEIGLQDELNRTLKKHGGRVSSDETDAKIAAAEARSETGLVRAMAELRSHTDQQVTQIRLANETLIADVRTGFAQVNGRLDHLEKSTSGIKSTVVLTAIASVLSIIGAIIGVLTYGDALFGRGLTISDAIDGRVKTQIEQRVQAPPKPTQ